MRNWVARWLPMKHTVYHLLLPLCCIAPILSLAQPAPPQPIFTISFARHGTMAASTRAFEAHIKAMGGRLNSDTIGMITADWPDAVGQLKAVRAVISDANSEILLICTDTKESGEALCRELQRRYEAQ
jgi:hypothetical protein